jgi:hypothetical protein
MLPGYQRLVIGGRAAVNGRDTVRQASRAGGADIHRTVHNSVIVWTTSSGDGVGRAVGFATFADLTASVAPQETPR